MGVVVVVESGQDAAPLLDSLLRGVGRTTPVTIGVVAPARPLLSNFIALSGAGTQLTWDYDAIRGRACHEAHQLLAHVPDHLAARACVFSGWRDVLARV